MDIEKEMKNEKNVSNRNFLIFPIPCFISTSK